MLKLPPKIGLINLHLSRMVRVVRFYSVEVIRSGVIVIEVMITSSDLRALPNRKDWVLGELVCIRLIRIVSVETEDLKIRKQGRTSIIQFAFIQECYLRSVNEHDWL